MLTDPPPSITAVIGVDPGTSAGCVSCLNHTGITVSKLPTTPQSFFEHIQDIHYSNPDAYWFVEDVGKPRPGTALQSVHTFSKHRGHLEMALIATGAASRSVFVSPDAWMTELIPSKDWPHGNQSKQVTARKKHFADLARTSYPDTKIHQYAGDAVCIMLYGVQQLWKKTKSN